MGKTLADKVWEDHVVHRAAGEPDLIYIDLHLIHEVTSPQAFDGLRLAGRAVRRPDLTIATEDHNTPTIDIDKPIADPVSKVQVDTLRKNAKDFGIRIHSLGDVEQGIVHVVGPQLGLTQPGMTVVCGDSHTSTHGAFGGLAFGIGTSEVEHVLATQTLPLSKPKMMAVNIEGVLPAGVTSKDIILAFIAKIGTGGGQGFIIEYRGSAIRELSMEGRMTICNMSIEAGARAGLISPDKTTFEYLKGRPLAPAGKEYDDAIKYWESLATDDGAHYDEIVEINADDIIPQITWGTSPEDVVSIDGFVPDPKNEENADKKKSIERALDYMGLEPNTPVNEIKVDKVFIGSCTNGRIEDLRAVSIIAKGRKVAESVHAMIVPGSGLVKEQAEKEGLDKIFIDAGFDWRDPGCSMCLAMNADKLQPQERCASTSNRNFEGRQGRGGRTHLMSPQMAAAAAITGKLTDFRDL